jgi:hypothetical protein
MYATLGVVELTPLDVGTDPTLDPYYQPDGVVINADPLYPDGSDPAALTPSTISTTVVDYSGPSPVIIQPVTVDPTMIPQQLPPLTANAPAGGGMPGWAWVGLGLLALLALSKGGGGRSGRSW